MDKPFLAPHPRTITLTWNFGWANTLEDGLDILCLWSGTRRITWTIDQRLAHRGKSDIRNNLKRWRWSGSFSIVWWFWSLSIAFIHHPSSLIFRADPFSRISYPISKPGISRWLLNIKYETPSSSFCTKTFGKGHQLSPVMHVIFST